MTILTFSLLLFIVIGGTVGASAECAWVLWKKDDSIIFYYKDEKISDRNHSTSWEIHSASTSRKGCDEIQERVWNVLSRGTEGGGIEKIERVPNAGVYRQFKGGGFWNTELYCLPDTVDPRNTEK